MDTVTNAESILGRLCKKLRAGLAGRELFKTMKKNKKRKIVYLGHIVRGETSYFAR